MTRMQIPGVLVSSLFTFALPTLIMNAAAEELAATPASITNATVNQAQAESPPASGLESLQPEKKWIVSFGGAFIFGPKTDYDVTVNVGNSSTSVSTSR